VPPVRHWILALAFAAVLLAVAPARARQIWNADQDADSTKSVLNLHHLTLAPIAEPNTGTTPRCWFDAASATFACRGALGVLTHGVQTSNPGGNFVIGIGADGYVYRGGVSASQVAGLWPVAISGNGSDLNPASTPLDRLSQSGATSGQVPSWNGTAWVPSAPAAAGLADPGGNGLVVRTALNTTINRLLAVDSTLTLSNADGTAGNPTLGRGAVTGDVSIPLGSNVATISANAVTVADMQQIAGLSVLGRSASTTGNMAAITATSGSGGVLRESGGVVGFGNISASVLTGLLPCSNLPALTGDVTTAGCAATVANLPNGATWSGWMRPTNTSIVGTPGAGTSYIWVDATAKNLFVRNDAAVVNHGIQSMTASSHLFLTGVGDDGLPTRAQPVEGDVVNLTSDLALKLTDSGSNGVVVRTGVGTTSAYATTLHRVLLGAGPGVTDSDTFTFDGAGSGTIGNGTSPASLKLVGGSVTPFVGLWQNATPTAAMALAMGAPGSGAPGTGLGVWAWNGTAWTERFDLTNAGIASFPAYGTGMAKFNAGQLVLATVGVDYGLGTVTSVSGTAGRITVSPSSPNPVVDLATFGTASSCAHASVTTDAYGRTTCTSGTFPAGVLIGAGTSTVTAFSAGAGRIPFGSGSGGGFTDSADLTWSSPLLFLGNSTAGGGSVTVGGSNGNSAIAEFWSNTTPSFATSIGLRLPGTAADHDFHFSTYNGATWSDRLVLSNSTGSVTFPAYGSGITKLVSGTLTLATSADVQSAIVWPLSTQIGVGTSSSTAVAGSAELTFSSPLLSIGNTATGGAAVITAGANGNSGVLNFWSDTTPNFATAVGMRKPGTSADHDLHLATYNGAAWSDRLVLSNSTGTVTFPAYGSGLTKLVLGALTLATSADVTSAIVWPLSGQVGVGTSSSTALAGSAELTFSSQLFAIGNSATGGSALVVAGSNASSGVMNFWSNNTPSAAFAAGMRVPGSSSDTNFHLSAFSGGVWTERLKMSSSVGDLTLRAGNGLTLVPTSSTAQVVQFFMDSTPTKAVSVGNAIPGTAIGPNVSISTFNGTTWTERMNISNAGGIVQIGSLTNDSLVATDGAHNLGAAIVDNPLSYSGGHLSVSASAAATFIFAYGAGGYSVNLPSGGLGHAPDFWFRPMTYTVSAGEEFAAYQQTWEYPVQSTFGHVDLSAYVYVCGITTTGGVDALIFEVTKNGTRTGVKFTVSCPAANQLNTAYAAVGSVSISPGDRLGVEGYDAATGTYSSGALRAAVTLQLRP
jgi:hypothetical protein